MVWFLGLVVGDGGFGWVWWFSGCLLSVWVWWSVVGDLVFMSDGGWLHLGFPGLLDFVGHRNMLLG